jgi:hypothetical protein
MSFVRSFATCALLACVGCASTGDPGASNPPYSPPSSTASSPASSPAPTEPTTVSNQNPGSIPVGQELDVRLQTSLSSDTAAVEQRFESTTAVDLMQNDRVLVPAGTVVRGVVSGVDKADRINRAGRLTLAFDQMVVNGREVPIRATATQVFESGGIRDEVGTAGVGAGVGGLVGGILGGVKGALLGAVIGAGGAIAATEGKDINLPAGTIVRIRMDSPANVR